MSRTSKARREWVPTRRCPCGGRFFHDVQPYSNHGVFFGHYVFWTCDKCGETVVPPSDSETLDQVAKAKGLYGLEAAAPPIRCT